ncbi:NDMA-dependent alcohol dehydrogenase [Aeromicrobium sp. CFBP 8757]|uniref:NDMA-dependent alcohol dehydrogenase n=1 Tax=Aeromicrobium sp. CFBP 8757 TaxID=2775288 RepID=UPI00177D1655|nr:NDMA-dependent alcohol dehydrogenase [Aeromicrobium sp. CFBP 8757]MBD8605447.1 NDMA-dependent alcohol dehydrogenase [Aeromicrobium sp. CFBP 8757]
MQTRAALLRESPGTYEVTTVELDDPRQGELLIKMVATGLCHTDDHMRSGDLSPGHLPFIGGHEGAGVVLEVGPHTPGWDVGDHVIFAFLPACGKCRWCSQGQSSLCDLGALTMVGSRLDDPTDFRVQLPDGTPVGQAAGLGTFAEHTVVSVDSAIKVDKDLPLDKVCLLGCAVGTGWGSAVNSAEVAPGDVVIVAGAGGIGMNAIQGASHAGASTIIAVDPIAFKRESALTLGATHAFATIPEAADFARSLTNGQGADSTILTIGVVQGQDVADGFSAIRKAGTLVLTGMVPPSITSLPISGMELTFFQKRIQGSMYGAGNARVDIPRQIRMYREGRLKLDELITKTYTLDEVSQGYADMNSGQNIRGVVIFD